MRLQNGVPQLRQVPNILRHGRQQADIQPPPLRTARGQENIVTLAGSQPLVSHPLLPGEQLRRWAGASGAEEGYGVC